MQARHFKEMLSTANHLKQVKKVKIKEADLEPLQESYKVCGQVVDSAWSWRSPSPASFAQIAISRLKQHYEKA